MNNESASCYVVAREPGTLRSDLPLWASSEENPLQLAESPGTPISSHDVEGVPGAFQLHNVLNVDECRAFIETAEQMGYTEDAAVSLGRDIRHNMNLNWIVDTTTERRLWSRVASKFSEDSEQFLDTIPLGLNQRFRFYRYAEGDYFAAHTDGAWPGSQVRDGRVITDAFGDRYSLYTFLIFLNDDFSGGQTRFLVNKNDPSRPARDQKDAMIIDVRTPLGGVLCFPHGMHPLHCIHSSAVITHGTKYIIRTDVLFSL